MEANSTPEKSANPPSQTDVASPRTQMPEEVINPRHIAVLAIIAGLILLIGTFVKPATETEQQPVSQTELVRLRRAGQKATLENMSRYFSDVAGEFSTQVVRLPRLEASGLVWDDYGGIVAAAPGGWTPSGMDLIAPGGGMIPVVRRIGGPHLPVVFLQAPVNTALPQVKSRSPETLRVGEWVLAVDRKSVV